MLMNCHLVAHNSGKGDVAVTVGNNVLNFAKLVDVYALKRDLKKSWEMILKQFSFNYKLEPYFCYLFESK
jgi:hypothetical protein